MSGLHPSGLTRIIRITSGSGTRKRRAYKKRTGGLAIVHRPLIRIGVGVRRRKPKTTTHVAVRSVRRVNPVVVGSAWQLSSTRRGTGHKRKPVSRPRMIKLRII